MGKKYLGNYNKNKEEVVDGDGSGKDTVEDKNVRKINGLRKKIIQFVMLDVGNTVIWRNRPRIVTQRSHYTDESIDI